MSENLSDRLTFRQVFQTSGPGGKTALIIATWFGCGLAPKAPGTVGTLGALPLALLMLCSGTVIHALIPAVLILAGIWASEKAEKLLGGDDPAEVVIDEAAGLMVALFLLPPVWWVIIGAFILFRFFDIAKPFPIRRLERIGGGTGIVLDDLVAGIYANAAMRILLAVFHF